MSSREAFFAGYENDGENIEAMIKKHEDFDEAIGNQEEQIESLITYADQLISSEHYAYQDILNKRKEVLKSWESLKEALIGKRSKLEEKY